MNSPLRNLRTNPDADGALRYSRKSLRLSPAKSNLIIQEQTAEKFLGYFKEDWEFKLNQMRIFNFQLERENRARVAELQVQAMRLDDAIADAAQSALEAQEASTMVESMSQLTSPKLLEQVNSLLALLKAKSDALELLQEEIHNKDAEIKDLKAEIFELKCSQHGYSQCQIDGNPVDEDTMTMVVQWDDAMLAQEQTVVIF
jgi:hypothetical protein